MGAKKTFITSSIFLMAILATVPAFAASRYTTTRHHRGHVRRVAWNPVLKGSMDSMVRQNEEIDRLQLPRIGRIIFRLDGIAVDERPGQVAGQGIKH